MQCVKKRRKGKQTKRKNVEQKQTCKWTFFRDAENSKAIREAIYCLYLLNKMQTRLKV